MGEHSQTTCTRSHARVCTYALVLCLAAERKHFVIGYFFLLFVSFQIPLILVRLDPFNNISSTKSLPDLVKLS
jgi:hypothetical protein